MKFHEGRSTREAINPETDAEQYLRDLLGYDDSGEDLPLAEEIDDDLPIAEEIDEDFLLAPDESHVQAMRYSEQGEATYIDVRFKPQGNAGVMQYRYTFGPGGRDFAKMVFDEMSGSAHPGVDIWAYLIRGGIPYQKTALS